MNGNERHLVNDDGDDPKQAGSPGRLTELFGLALSHHHAGRLAEAEVVYRKLLEIAPNWVEVCNNLGVIFKSRGDLQQAQAHFERAVAGKPDYPDAQNNLGNVLRDQGKLDEAAARYRRALALKPDFAEAHNNLGNALKDQGQFDQALLHYQQALALKPNYAEACNNLGNVLRDLRQFDQAAARFEQALALKPNFAEAYYNLGNVLTDLGQLDEAVARFEQALALRPNFAEAYFNLGSALTDLGQLDQAVVRFEQALALKPNAAETCYALGNALKDQGHLDRAAARYEQALALKPSFPDAHNNLGNVLKYQGKLDQAAARFEQAIALEPDYVQAHYNRAELRTFRPGDADLRALEALAADPGRLSPEKMVYIHFALSKALEDIGRPDLAFEQLIKGNALKRQQVNYDEAGTLQSLRLIADAFVPELFDRFPGAGDPSPAPIFILGMPRSGSTLIEQILASHPQVHAAGELYNLNLLASRGLHLDGRLVPYPACLTALSADGLGRFGQAYLADLPRLPAGKLRITDKMPMNYLYVGLIRLALPNARIIHTVRDPVDTCLSCFSRLFSSGQTFSYDLGEMGRYYRTYRELMARWRSVLPAGAMLDVSYEHTVEALEAQARRLIEYCGLPWDDRCLSFHETSRPIVTASSVQVRRPLYHSSVARWRRYEAYLQRLLVELDGCGQG